ncbi:hypothetical protein CSPAE12_03803 [Colletotrichum incanum]|nr:hypothetical protein CSPAE12_03803 [Colletotrichum incanum]
MPHGENDSYDDGRHDDTTDESICVQYEFSQTVLTSQGIPTIIRILSISNDTLATVHGNRDVLIWNLFHNVPPRCIDVDIMMDHVTGIAISPYN